MQGVMHAVRCIGIVLIVLLALGHGPASADTTGNHAQAQDSIRFDTAATSRQPSALAHLVGDIHPAVVHFPIAWMTLLALVELLALGKSRAHLHRTGLYLLLLAIASFAPAAISGLMAAEVTRFAGVHAEILQFHRNLNLAAAGLAVVALLARGRFRIEQNRIHRLIYVGVIVAATACTLYAASLGGKLVHG